MATIHAGLTLLFTAALVQAQAPPEFLISFRDGRTAQVQLLERDGERAKLQGRMMGATMRLVVRLDELTPISRYRIEIAASPPSSFDEHFALAKRAGEWRLLPQAVRHLRAALEAAADAVPSATASELDTGAIPTSGEPTEASARADERQAQVRQWAADWLTSIVREALAERNVHEADRRLGLLCTRLSDRCTEERLEELAQEVDALRAELEQERADARRARIAEREREQIQRRLQPIQERIAFGDRRLREALKNSRSTVRSTNLAEQAMQSYRSAWQSAQELERKFPDNEELANEIAAIGMQLQERAVRASLHAANALTLQSDFRGAMRWVDEVAALDPDNADAKELRRTIQIASAAAGGWGWGWDFGQGPR